MISRPIRTPNNRPITPYIRKADYAQEKDNYG